VLFEVAVLIVHLQKWWKGFYRKNLTIKEQLCHSDNDIIRALSMLSSLLCLSFICPITVECGKVDFSVKLYRQKNVFRKGGVTMVSMQFLSFLLVLPGSMFMLASLVMCIGMSKSMPDILKTKWSAVTYLIVFFIGGYIAFLFIQLWDLPVPLDLLTSTVFLGGAIFVFLVMRLSMFTIKKIEENRKQISEANQALIAKNKELVIAYDSTIEGWGKALVLRDKETEDHSQRVTEMTLRTARAYGMNEEELVHVRQGALLHDIGKMGVPDSILLKEETLTPEEEKIMQNHPQNAYNILKPIEYLRHALDIPYCHHEKWDGSGYPRGLQGEQIPLAARIFALADSWDALVSERRYRKAWSREKVTEYIRSQAGIQFDPKLVELFLANV
jgi:putative nucleotidyltransferase with HDIG domain